MKTLWNLKVLGLLAGLALSACASVNSYQDIKKAEQQIELAQSASAESQAIYEFTKAKIYLDLAKSAEDHSQYEISIGYAKKALFYAEEAARIADRSRISKP
jgi:hypothetical protein